MSYRCPGAGGEYDDECGALVFGGWGGNRAAGPRYATDGHTMIDLGQLAHPAALALLRIPCDDPRRVPDDKCAEVIELNTKGKVGVYVQIAELYESGWVRLDGRPDGPAYVNADKLMLVNAAVGDLPMVQYGGALGVILFGDTARPAAMLMPLKPLEHDEAQRMGTVWARPVPVEPGRD